MEYFDENNFLESKEMKTVKKHVTKFYRTILTHPPQGASREL